MTSLDNLIANIHAFKRDVASVFPKLDLSATSIEAAEFDIAIITATRDEFRSILGLLKNPDKLAQIGNDSTTYYSASLSNGEKEFSIVLPYPVDMGINAAVGITTKVISNFKPEYLFMVGIAAGNKSVCKVGDILIAEKSINYDEVVEIERKDGTRKVKFMQNQDSVNKGFKGLLTEFADSPSIGQIREDYPQKEKIENDLKCNVGLLVTGSSLVKSQSMIEDLVATYHNVIGLDMETSGFYYSAAHTLRKEQPYFVSIKSVSDFGDNANHKLSSDERKDYALYTSSTATVRFIVEHL